jgi:3-oxoacyl-[acyl-carrier protein] reductase
MRNILVTGGSRGLGLSIARKLAAAGYSCIATARKQSDKISSAIKENERSNTGSLRFVPFDLAQTENIPEFIRNLRKEYGPIYGLVNNAAVLSQGLLATMHNSKIEQLVRVNTLAPIIITKYVVRSMMAEGGGRIVNVASIIGFTGYSGLAAYAATKASIIGLTRSLAREVGSLGINVNAVAPGALETDMAEMLNDKQREQIARRSALRRLASVEDVANAVEFLLGDASRSITGTVVTVDAGSTA